ncbi:MAG: hypothetical protein WBA63_01940 [Thermomicrobiales bacterium]
MPLHDGGGAIMLYDANGAAVLTQAVVALVALVLSGLGDCGDTRR